jgi:hypothetical protein
MCLWIEPLGPLSVVFYEAMRCVNTISRLIALLLAAGLTSCADMQERSRIVGQRIGRPLTASVGNKAGALAAITKSAAPAFYLVYGLALWAW